MFGILNYAINLQEMKNSSALPMLIALFVISTADVTVRPAAAQQCPDCSLAAVDWTTMPSTYTHRDGAPVDQYAQVVEPTTYANELRQTSIFHHHRSSLQGNNSADHYHRVDRYGPPVQPYGEWRYPYRPFSVPYAGWGPQLPQAVANVGVFPRGYGAYWPHDAAGQGGGIGPGVQPAPGLRPNLPGNQWPGGFNPWLGGSNPLQDFGSGFLPGPGNALLPGQDEYYPMAPEPPPMSDRDFFYSPIRP